MSSASSRPWFTVSRVSSNNSNILFKRLPFRKLIKTRKSLDVPNLQIRSHGVSFWCLRFTFNASRWYFGAPFLVFFCFVMILAATYHAVEPSATPMMALFRCALCRLTIAEVNCFLVVDYNLYYCCWLVSSTLYTYANCTPNSNVSEILKYLFFKDTYQDCKIINFPANISSSQHSPHEPDCSLFYRR